MKRLLAAALTLTCLLAFAACANRAERGRRSKRAELVPTLNATGAVAESGIPQDPLPLDGSLPLIGADAKHVSGKIALSSKIEGLWSEPSSSCRGVRQALSVRETGWVRAERHYADTTNCREPEYEIKVYLHPLDPGEATRYAGALKGHLEFDLQKITLTPLSDTAAKTLSDLKEYGLDAWKKNTELEVTGKDGKPGRSLLLGAASKLPAKDARLLDDFSLSADGAALQIAETLSSTGYPGIGQRFVQLKPARE